MFSNIWHLVLGDQTRQLEILAEKLIQVYVRLHQLGRLIMALFASLQTMESVALRVPLDIFNLLAAWLPCLLEAEVLPLWNQMLQAWQTTVQVHLHDNTARSRGRPSHRLLVAATIFGQLLAHAPLAVACAPGLWELCSRLREEIVPLFSSTEMRSAALVLTRSWHDTRLA